MAKEAEFQPKILLNWPPEREFHQPEERTRTKSKFTICLLLLGLAGYYYLRIHG